jgi:acetylornithine deacetylase
MKRVVDPQRLRKLLLRILDIYSPSGKEEEITEYLYGYLRRRGLPVRRQPVDENRYNLVVFPPDVDVRLALVGHLDTVPAFDLERYGPEQRGDEVVGLGAADMKGGCAAMIEAYLTLWAAGPPVPPVALALVVGEEEEGDGAEALAREFHFPWAIIGEPTDLKPCFSHFGYLELLLCTSGQRRHASLAEKNQSPVETLLNLLIRITRFLSLQRPELVYNIRDLFSHQAGFIVPERCEARLDMHAPPSAPLGEITLELEERVADFQKEHAEIRVSFRFETIDAGYELPQKGAAADSLREAFHRLGISWEPQSFRSHSDANRLWVAGVKPVLLGPGRLEKAHAPDESVSLEQVLQAARVYREIGISLPAE